jgi:DNA-binding NarL/FixJ family response regulator
MLLLHMPPLLRELFEHAVERRHDCALLKESRSTLDMLRGSAERPDVVVVGLSTADDAAVVPALFARWPNAQIMTVTVSGHGGMVYELKPNRRVLDEMSPAEIVETLHATIRHERELTHREGGRDE